MSKEEQMAKETAQEIAKDYGDTLRRLGKC